MEYDTEICIAKEGWTFFSSLSTVCTLHALDIGTSLQDFLLFLNSLLRHCRLSAFRPSCLFELLGCAWELEVACDVGTGMEAFIIIRAVALRCPIMKCEPTVDKILLPTAIDEVRSEHLNALLRRLSIPRPRLSLLRECI